MPLSRKTACWAKGVHVSNLAFLTINFPIYILVFVNMQHFFHKGRRVGKGKRKAANGEWHFVIFFVQNACGGFAAFFLPWGLFYGVNEVNTIKQTWQTEHCV
jgi:hypothetical protein